MVIQILLLPGGEQHGGRGLGNPAELPAERQHPPGILNPWNRDPASEALPRVADRGQPGCKSPLLKCSADEDPPDRSPSASRRSPLLYSMLDDALPRAV